MTQTKMTDDQRLADALTALGYSVIPGTNVVTAMRNGTEELRFSRDRKGLAFGTFVTDLAKLQAVQRKYSELSVRAFAKRSGMNVAASDGRKMTLINRRG